MVLGAVLGGVAGGAGVSILINAIDNFSGTFARAKIGMSAMGIAAGVAVAGVAALTVGLVKATKSAAEIETGFAKVNTLLDEGQSAQELFSKFIEETNVAMGNQGDQLSALDGLYQTISAGITDTAEAQNFLAIATKAAVGGSAELSTVILAGTKAIAAFGLSVDDTERVMDAFAGTVKAGQTTMGELAAAFPNVAGMAGQAGMSIEETLGTFAGLTKVLASSEETATALSATIRGFIKPTTDMKDAVSELGYESSTTMVKELGLNEALKQLNENVDGDTEALAKLFPNVRALKAVFPLLGLAAEDVADSIDIVSNSAGLATKQYEDMTNTLEFKWGAAMSEAKNKFIALGNTMKELVLPILEELIPIIGDSLVGVLEGFKNIITPILPIIVDMIKFLFDLGKTIGEILSPIIKKLSEKWAEVSEKMKPFLGAVGQLIIKAFELAAMLFGYLWPAISIIIDISTLLIPVFTLLVKVIGWIIDAVKFLIGLLDKLTFGIFSKGASAINSFTNDVLGATRATDKLNKSLDISSSLSNNITTPSTSSSSRTSSSASTYVGINAAGQDVWSSNKVIQLNDFILSNGKIIQPNSQDTIIGTKNPGAMGGITVYIDNLNGFNARDIANELQDELKQAIRI